jgi:hypothetical protein
MAIAIPAPVDALLAALQAELRPKTDVATNTSSSPTPPYARGNRVADLLSLLTGLIDVSGLTATGGTANSVQDTGAFTGVNSLVGAKVTFVGDTTAALAGVYAIVASNTVNELVFGAQVYDASGNVLGALPGTPAAGDTYGVEYAAVDTELAVLSGGKGLGSSQSNPYSDGPTMAGAMVKLIELLGGTLPSYLDPAAPEAEPFGLLSPHGAGDGQYGHAGATLLADALQVVRDTVAAYTVPA